MAELKLQSGSIIGDYKLPYIVAEVNSSHNGNVETAKEMIRKIKECGCNCVKFQSWSSESLYSKSYYARNPISKRIVQKFALSEDNLLSLAEYCKNLNIDFSSTPYSRSEVDFLTDKCKIPFIKIASMEINNYDFLEYIALKNVPMVLSTGMADIEEIKKAVKVIESTGNNQLALLHCISIYPADVKTINLNNILTLRDMFPDYPIGFSDHTLGTAISCAATALGSAILEKHFTLDKTKMGMDNNMAIEPCEMKELVLNCQNVFYSLGSRNRIVREEEYQQRLKMRRSIIAKMDLKKGTILTKEMIDFKRPGDGITPDKFNEVLGKKLKNDIQADYLINFTDIE